MKRYINYLFLLILFTSGSSAVAADVTKVATTAAPFLTIGAGARAQGMGGAFVAVANDASALFWNVSGIAQLQQNEFVFNHSQWIADIDYNYAGIAAPLAGFGTVGVSITTVDYGTFEQTTEMSPEGTGVEFNARSMSLNLSWARMLTENFAIGFTGKYIQESIFNSRASGMAMDIGVLFVTPFNGLRLGMSISNFGAKMGMEGDDLLVKVDIDQTIDGNNNQVNARIETGKYDLPLLFRFGVAMDVFQTEENRLTLVADALHPNDNAESVNLGAEYQYGDMLALRAGYRSLFLPDSEEGFTLGGGLKFDSIGLRLDYAYEDFGKFNNIQKYSLHFMF
jgi:long-subunit fatty acid transport protein